MKCENCKKESEKLYPYYDDGFEEEFMLCKECKDKMKNSSI